MARSTSKILAYDFDPRNFYVSSLADVLAAASADVPFSRVEIGINDSGPTLKQSDEIISNVPLGRKVIWECTKPFRLTFSQPPDGNSSTKKFSGTEGKDGIYRVEIAFINHDDDGTGKLTISYEIQAYIQGKWVGKDPSVIIDTTAMRFFVLVPKSPDLWPTLGKPVVSSKPRSKAKRGGRR